ncbi:MAG: hypothetical protein ACRDSJ_17025 [Rubrobacteraceae bacterium]
MRSVAPWLLGSLLAFLATSAAFLTLANLGSEPSEVRLEPREPPPRSDSPLELLLDANHLDSLSAGPGQVMTLRATNGGDDGLSDVSLTVEVSSEDTTLLETRRQRKTIEEIKPGESAEIPFELDLSPPDTASDLELETPRAIIEVRATTPSGVSTVRTAVLPL